MLRINVYEYQKFLTTLEDTQQVRLIRWMMDHRYGINTLVRIDAETARYNKYEWIKASAGYKLWEHIESLIQDNNEGCIYIYIQ